MDFVIEYNIAAIGVLIFFLVAYMLKKHLHTKLNRAFFRLAIAVLLVSTADTLSVLIETYCVGARFIPLQYAINIGLFLALVNLYLSYVFFIYRLTGISCRVKRYINAVLLPIAAFHIVLVVTSPIFHAIFYVDENGTYCYGKLHLLVYMVPAFALLLAFFVLFSRRRQIKREQMISVYFFSGVILVCTLLQAFVVPQILMTYYFSMLGLLMIYFSFQSPEYYLDRVTDSFNEEGLREILREHFEREKTLFAVIVHPSNIDVLCEENDRGTLDQIMLVLKNGIELALSKRTSLYRLDDIFCLLFEEKDSAQSAAQAIISHQMEGQVAAEHRIPLDLDILLVAAPEHFKSYEGLIGIIRYFRKNPSEEGKSVIINCDDVFLQKRWRYEEISKIVRSAIRNEAISIFYQPIFSVEQQAFCSAEALVRLSGSADGLGDISPEEFVPIAEQENLIYDLGMLIVKKVCDFAKQYQPWERGVQHIEVNLSVKQCMQNDLCRVLNEMILQYGLEPTFFTFELTETAIADAKRVVADNMEQLMQSGSRFALDDFGSGYANFNYLLQFPFQFVKLDKELVWAHYKQGNDKSKIVLEYIIQMLHKMGMTIIAEGVENLQMMEELSNAGVQYLQGYHFSAPLGETEYLKFLKKHAL